MADESLVGTWRLMSARRRTAAGDVSFPWGTDATGYLIYTADGHVSAVVMERGRKTMSCQHIKSASQAEKASAAESYFSYAGRYQITDGRVVHSIDMALFPNWTGLVTERSMDLSDGILRLGGPMQLVDGVMEAREFEWRRVGDERARQ
jgi:hypothetical protein